MTIKPHVPAGWVAGPYYQLKSGKWLVRRVRAMCWCELDHSASVHLRAKTRKARWY